MKGTKNIVPVLSMHAAFLVYSLYPLIGKYAARNRFLSLPFMLLASAAGALLCIYAVLWQQVLKHVPLATAIASKSITIVWEMVFGRLCFGEEISPKMLAGTALIVIGIFVLNRDGEQ